MGQKFAVDFGTTNSVVAQWNDTAEQAELVHLASLSLPQADLPLIPSLVYMDEAEIVSGQQVKERKLHYREDNRLFQNFKRGLLTIPPPAPRSVNGHTWTTQAVATHFLTEILQKLPTADMEQLVLTVPVTAFEHYLSWLTQLAEEQGISSDKIRVVDESTAAALGYAVQETGAPVLVVDFGGGTLDLSLVQLPEERVKTGGFLGFLNRRDVSVDHSAQVIAKAGQPIGGSDIDQWLVQFVLNEINLTPQSLGDAYAPLLAQCEQAKIDLSTADTTTITIKTDDTTPTVTLTRTQFDEILATNGLFDVLRRTVDKVMLVARQRQIFKEDIRYVLMVGGTSLVPAIQAELQAYFSELAVRADKPFTAVVEGALQLAAGLGLQDYLQHSYALRYLDEDGHHQFEEIIPMGTEYPSEPVEIMLEAAHDSQSAIEFVIGEINADAVGMVEVQYEGDQMVFVAKPDENQQQINAINLTTRPLAELNPSGKSGETRLKASFYVDNQRQLRVTVTDIRTKQTLLKEAILGMLQ